MKKNKLTLAILLTSVSLVVAGAVFANSNLPEMRIQLGAGEKQTYQYIKTDFRLESGPTPSISFYSGQAHFSLVEEDSIFTSKQSDDSIFWNHDGSYEDFFKTDDGIFGIEDGEQICERGKQRSIAISFIIAAEGDREIINLGTNSFCLIQLYYNDGTKTTNREYTITPSYSNENYSSVSFEIDTYSNDFDYESYRSEDIYKVVLKSIQLEYSCSK